jgi:polyisoprenyl-phosphate glycosyltransferase
MRQVDIMDTSEVGLSVVIPCFNEAEGITELLRRVSASARASFGDDYEIILVNDGSTDSSWNHICAHVEDDNHVVGVNLARNHGHQLALSAGLDNSRGAHIFILDADLQDPPELLAVMMQQVKAGHDVVFGQRRTRAGETAFKRSTATLFYRLIDKLVDIRIPQDTGDFRLMTRRVLKHLNAMPERYRFVRGMVSWIGYRQTAVLYDRDARFAGETKYPVRKMIAFAIDAITSFSVVPLRLASWVGAVASIAGLLALCWVFIAWMAGNTISGWTSLAVIILIIGSAQLIMLGIIGEYIGRMYMESKRRPLFIIDQIYTKQRKTVNPVQEMRHQIESAVNG